MGAPPDGGDTAVEHVEDTIGGVAVPQRRSARDAPHRERRTGGAEHALGIESHQLVRALGDRHWPLGVLPERQAGRPQHGGLLLEPAGVGEHETCRILQADGFEVADRRTQFDSTQVDAERLDVLTGAGMDREDER